MWIRSQNKSFLIDAKAIDYVPYLIKPVNFRIYAWSSGMRDEDETLLGVYDTEEQVIKVLDMIQEHVENTHFDTLSCNYLTGDGNVQVPFQTAKAVFQMPAISEVEAMLSKEKEWTVEEILKREG